MALVGSTGKSKPNRPSLRVNRKSGTKSSAPMPKPKALPGRVPPKPKSLPKGGKKAVKGYKAK